MSNDDLKVLKINSLPVSDPIVSQILLNLESTQGDIISKATIIKAIQKIAEEEQIVINGPQLGAIVESIFNHADSGT